MPLVGPRLALVSIAAADHRLRPSTFRLFAALMWSYHAGRPWTQSWAGLARHLGLRGTAARRARRELEEFEYLAFPRRRQIVVPLIEVMLPREQRAGELRRRQFTFGFLELATSPLSAASHIRKHMKYPQ